VGVRRARRTLLAMTVTRQIVLSAPRRMPSCGGVGTPRASPTRCYPRPFPQRAIGKTSYLAHLRRLAPLSSLYLLWRSARTRAVNVCTRPHLYQARVRQRQSGLYRPGHRRGHHRKGGSGAPDERPRRVTETSLILAFDPNVLTPEPPEGREDGIRLRIAMRRRRTSFVVAPTFPTLSTTWRTNSVRARPCAWMLMTPTTMVRSTSRIRSISWRGSSEAATIFLRHSSLTPGPIRPESSLRRYRMLCLSADLIRVHIAARNTYERLALRDKVHFFTPGRLTGRLLYYQIACCNSSCGFFPPDQPPPEAQCAAIVKAPPPARSGQCRHGH
jgi:hypothetical protein